MPALNWASGVLGSALFARLFLLDQVSGAGERNPKVWEARKPQTRRESRVSVWVCGEKCELAPLQNGTLQVLKNEFVFGGISMGLEGALAWTPCDPLVRAEVPTLAIWFRKRDWLGYVRAWALVQKRP